MKKIWMIPAIATVVIVLLSSVLMPVINDQVKNDDDVLNVFVIRGQSNAAYIVDYMDLDTVNSQVSQVSENCYYFGYDSGTCRPVNNLGDQDNASTKICSMSVNGSWVIGGEDVPIAAYLASHTHSDTLIINVAIPGQAISYFEPSNDGGVYAKAIIDRALSLIPSHYTVHKLGWMWCQGESDQQTSYSSYIDSFKLINNAMDSYGFEKCYLVETKPTDSGNAAVAQGMIVSSISNVILSSTAPEGFTVANGGLISGNTLHYTQAGRIIVGDDVASHVIDSINETSYNSLYLAVPVMIIAALLILVVRAVVTRND